MCTPNLWLTSLEWCTGQTWTAWTFLSENSPAVQQQRDTPLPFCQAIVSPLVCQTHLGSCFGTRWGLSSSNTESVHKKKSKKTFYTHHYRHYIPTWSVFYIKSVLEQRVLKLEPGKQRTILMRWSREYCTFGILSWLARTKERKASLRKEQWKRKKKELDQK